MQVFVNEKAIKNRIEYLKAKGKTIGFVPTMGALHEGHISLVRESKKMCDITVVSIFVNPVQFDNKDDLKKYPRTIESDKIKLKKAGVDILFFPTEDVIYPPGLDTGVNLDLEGLDEKWEGAFRPGHFAGVVRVVKRLLDIVEPDCLFMGQKDFQQFTIIKMMLEKLDIPVRLIVVPIFREKDGLAMSSRNVRLSPDFRQKSTVLYKMLKYAKKHFNDKEIEQIENYALEQIKSAGLKPEYFKIVDTKTLEPVKNGTADTDAVAIVAAWAGDVRLIDNMIL